MRTSAGSPQSDACLWPEAVQVSFAVKILVVPKTGGPQYNPYHEDPQNGSSKERKPPYVKFETHARNTVQRDQGKLEFASAMSQTLGLEKALRETGLLLRNLA